MGPAVPSVEQQAVIRHSVGPALPSAERLLGAGFTPQSNERCPTAVSGPVPSKNEGAQRQLQDPEQTDSWARPCLQWNEQRPTAVSRPGTHKVTKSLGPALPSAKRKVANGSFTTRNIDPLGPALPSVERKVANAVSGPVTDR